MKNNRSHHDRYASLLMWAVFAAASILLIYRIYSFALVAEDAFISFRVVDNAINGYGLRWNIHERVQVYTNPLWTLLHIPFYALFGHIVHVTLALSLACTIGAVAVALRSFGMPLAQAAVFFILPLAASRSFTQYSTSGLENPLTHLLFAAFGWAMLRPQHRYHWFFLSFFCALSLVNRLDLLLFYAPILTCLCMRQKVARWQLAAGFLPIVLWELFSLFYYGFLFPNTKYAKLDTGIGRSAYWEQGLNYLSNFIAVDFLPALAIMLAAWVLPAYLLIRQRRDGYLPWLAVPPGIIAYSVYIVSIGGDHVFGRFWSLPVFASLWLLYGMASRFSYPRMLYGLLAVLFIVVAFLSPTAKRLKKETPEYFQGKIARYPEHIRPWGPRRLIEPQPAKEPHFVIDDKVGISGYLAGPTTVIIDKLGITDPLLARLPSRYGRFRRIGHVWREIPKGYLYAVHTGDTRKMQPHLATYYLPLRQIVSGPLWSIDRLRTIAKFNLGAYDAAREEYLNER